MWKIEKNLNALKWVSECVSFLNNSFLVQFNGAGYIFFFVLCYLQTCKNFVGQNRQDLYCRLAQFIKIWNEVNDCLTELIISVWSSNHIFVIFISLGRYAKIITSPASVYLTSVLEYLVLEMMEGAGDVLKTDTKRRKRIYPRHIMLAVSSDQELQKLLENVTLPSTGRVSYINPVLLPLRTPLRKSSKK